MLSYYQKVNGKVSKILYIYQVYQGYLININETMKNEDWDNESEYDLNEEW